MFKLKPSYKKRGKCKYYYTRDKIEQIDSRCIKCNGKRDEHKNELAYLLRR